MTIIVACDEMSGIGSGGTMPWHISEDMRYFKKKTLGNVVVMGRKTWESLPQKPLPGRVNVVLTQNNDFSLEDAIVVHSIQEVLQLEEKFPDKEIFITGGGKVFEQFMPYVNKILLTMVYHRFKSIDTYFPTIDMTKWNIEQESPIQTDIKSGLRYQFMTLCTNL